MALVSSSQHLAVRSKKGAKFCPIQMYRHGKSRHTHYCVVEYFDGVSP